MRKHDKIAPENRGENPPKIGNRGVRCARYGCKSKQSLRLRQPSLKDPRDAGLLLRENRVRPAGAVRYRSRDSIEAAFIPMSRGSHPQSVRMSARLDHSSGWH